MDVRQIRRPRSLGALAALVLALAAGCGCGGDDDPIPMAGTSTLQVNNATATPVDVGFDAATNIIGAVAANGTSSFTVASGTHSVFIRDAGGGTTQFSSFFLGPGGTSILNWP